MKLRLLGPLDVWGSGLDPKPAGRPQKVEAVAYLATRVRGASAARCREDLWPEDRDDRPTSKVRNLMLGIRNWLGVNPATGREHIPPNPGEGRGGVYAVEGILIHADLFRRLRLRALARGVDGVADLRAALNLVTGSPFEGRRPAGYGWVGNTGLDYHYTGMIADAAHIVATHHLAADEPEAAAAAARVALTAPILLCAMQCRDVPADPATHAGDGRRGYDLLSPSANTSPATVMADRARGHPAYTESWISTSAISSRLMPISRQIRKWMRNWSIVPSVTSADTVAIWRARMSSLGRE